MGRRSCGLTLDPGGEQLRGKARSGVLSSATGGRRQLVPLCPALCLATTQTVEHVCDTLLFEDAHSECVRGFPFSWKKE